MVRWAGPATNLDLYENTVWLIIITMTTVGYGGARISVPPSCAAAISILALLQRARRVCLGVCGVGGVVNREGY